MVTMYSTDLVFGAAYAAQRINGDYIKNPQWPDTLAFGVTSNREWMQKLLKCDTALTGDYISEDDIAQGKKIRAHLQSAATFTLIKGEELTDFMKGALFMSNQEELGTNYDLAVIAWTPASYARSTARETAKNRVTFASGGFIGFLGDKVTVDVEVLRTVYSQQWGTYYVTGITDADQALFFSLKTNPAAGDKLKITGTVTAHRADDNQTQLNRVKIL